MQAADDDGAGEAATHRVTPPHAGGPRHEFSSAYPPKKKPQQHHQGENPTPSPPQAKTLWVFDLDGTLLVSHGREIIECDGMRAGIHPLIDPHVSSALPKHRSSDYRYCGEEDSHGDPHELIETAAPIERVAKVLRDATDDASSEVAILSARAHDPAWLSNQLFRKFALAAPIRPDLIQCVYSRAFERDVSTGSTPERKAAALEVLIARAGRPAAVHFFDDVQANLDVAVAHFASRRSVATTAPPPMDDDDDDIHVRLYPHLVAFEHAVEALVQAGVEPADVFHPQLRHERHEPSNDLVDHIQRQLSYSNLKELQKLAEMRPPPHVGGDDDDDDDPTGDGTGVEEEANQQLAAGDGVAHLPPAPASMPPRRTTTVETASSSASSVVASAGKSSASRRRALPP